MLSLLVGLGLAARIATAAIDSTELRGEALISALRHGGYTIMLRHTKTDRSVNEGPNYSNLKRADQRNLNDDGVRDAKLIGVVMKRFGIPVGEILSSQMYRARETAEYAFGDPTPNVLLQQLAASPEQRALVVAMPKDGTNRVIVTHHFIIERYAPGVRPGELAEGEAAVVKPASDGTLALVGRFSLPDWQALGAASVTGPEATAPAPGHGAATAVLPHTRAGKIAAEYLRAFNTGDSAVMQVFIETSLMVDPTRPLAARIASYRKLFDDHGPLALLAVQSSGDDAVSFSVRSKAGEPTLTLKLSADQPDRVASLTFAWNRAH